MSLGIRVSRRLPLPAVLVAPALVAPVLVVTLALVSVAAGAQTLLSQGRPAVASSTESSSYPAASAVDGSTSTRWSSQFSDPQWIYVDLGASSTITRVVLNWEAAYGRAYQIQVSNDASSWSTVYSTTSATGGVNDLSVSASGRYVRIYGTQRGTVYGYSLWELQVYGASGGQAPYGGTPRAIPGTIQAEDYDTGGEGVAYHDTTAGNSGGQYRSDGVDIEVTTDSGAGYDVGWTDVGEWLEYTVNVAASGSYTLDLRAASLSTGGTLHVEMDGANVTGTVTLPSTGGWQNWTTVSKAVSLTAGGHIMRVAIDSAGFNLNWLRFTSGTPGTCATLPSVPTGLASPSQTTSSVNLTWNASTPGANCTVSYRVFQNGSQATQVSTTSASIAGLAAGTTYSFTVAAVNQFGSSAQSGAIPVKTASAGKGMEVMTWVPSYSQSVWMAALNANTGGSYNPRNTLTRVAGQFFQVQANGTLVQGVPDSDVQWVVDYANANGIKFLICTHNYIDNWDWGTAASAFGSNRTALVNNLVNLVNRWGAAGVDVDFEGNLAGDPNRTEYGAFIRELGTRLHAMGKELTVDIFPYIWNQPNMNWTSDWVGYVDGVNSMGYDSLYGGGTSWQAYSWQQNTVLAAGYKCNQFDMGMPGWTGSWGAGGLGTSTLAHVDELRSSAYVAQPTSVAIWDAQFNGAGWLSADVWNGLHAIRMTTACSF